MAVESALTAETNAVSAIVPGRQSLGEFDYTNHFMVSPEYRVAASTRMLNEANFYAEKLRLPGQYPISLKKVSVAVFPPLRGGLGMVETKDFIYSFPGNDTKPLTNEFSGGYWFLEYGKVAYVMKKDPFKAYGTDIGEVDEALSNLQSLIDTNGAYRLATQWLRAVDIDVDELERQHKPLSIQQEYYDPPIPFEQSLNPPKDAPKKKRPIFDVTWGGPADHDPLVWIQILGPTKEFVLLRMGDTRFSKRPPIMITDALELNSRQAPPSKSIRPPNAPASRTNGLLPNTATPKARPK